ncbi:type II toxin-antitoxin system HicB family antitoxin [Sphingomonas sp.]|jgi:predicted HicB family RNase H-like nuclease|uniref:type II toxin-antitoxin system HicB family antitoxin n=1 Tax=Sphingomonas sp. TaxID=28214 RepID=UPI002D7E9D17|nr:type II toxin-antitoxin system HicB family antitoxin [Sphingomonas sp.]HEU0044076.1 type II toxin-antitoxin system HicB family antitoxin [Sphingomonas sp.]
MSNVMSHKGYSAAVEFDGEDGIFTGRIAGIRDGVGFHGESVSELRAAFQEAVDDYLVTCARLGRKPQKPYSGKLMLRVRPELHQALALKAELAGKSLNQLGEEALAAAVV